MRKFESINLVGSCLNKKKFSKNEVVKAMSRARKRKIELYSYRCVYCGGFHTTSLPQSLEGKKNRVTW